MLVANSAHDVDDRNALAAKNRCESVEVFASRTSGKPSSEGGSVAQSHSAGLQDLSNINTRDKHGTSDANYDGSLTKSKFEVCTTIYNLI